MDIIEIDGKTYDPYFILDVTREDSSSHIVKSFREKVKKYHPDKYTDPKKKEKYEKYFKILNESYRYIKDKRESVSKIRRIDDKKQNSNKKQNRLVKTFKEQNDLDDFNKSFNKHSDLEEQDQNYERLQRKEDYDNIDVKVYNQFEKRKFKLDEFNKMFEYTKGEDENDISKKSLVHKTTDGFYGYNTSESFALVSSFNGLMIVGDNFYKNGYWGSGYSDYKHSYKMPKNPNSKIIVPKEKKDKVNKIFKNSIQKNDRDGEISPSNGTFSQQENTLNKKIYDDLLKKELEDEAIVKQYISQYDESIVKKALSGELDQDIKFTSVLRRYIDN